MKTEHAATEELQPTDWEEMYARLEKSVSFLLRRSPDVFDGISAEDVVSKVLLDFLDSPNNLGWKSSKGSLTNFLSVVCRRNALDHLRRHGRASVSVDDLESRPAEDAAQIDPRRKYDTDILWRQLARTLNDSDKQVLSAIGQIDERRNVNQQLAERLGISVGEISSTKRRIRSRLAPLMNRDPEPNSIELTDKDKLVRTRIRAEVNEGSEPAHAQITSALTTETMDEFDDLLESRNISRLSRIAQELSEGMDRVDAITPNVGRFALRLAVLADLGCIDQRVLQKFLVKFPVGTLSELRLFETVNIRLAFAICEFLSGDLDLALKDAECVLGAKYSRDSTARMLAVLCKGRCLHELGQLKAAVVTFQEARKTAEQDGRLEMSAAIRIEEGRLQHQLGDRGAAERLFDEAWQGLAGTDDYVSRANIRSYQGKMFRRMGRYRTAFEPLTLAVELWRKHNCSHKYMARDLVQFALTKILEARRLESQLDRERIREAREREVRRQVSEANEALRQMIKKGDSAGISPSFCAALERILADRVANNAQVGLDRRITNELSEIDSLRQQALDHLAEATEIYENPLNPRGLASVLTYGCMLDMDVGELDTAEEKIGQAYKFADLREDNVATARIAIVWSSLLLMKKSRFDAAKKSEEAWNRAENTQNPRLKGRAAIACGNCAKSDGNLDEARQWRDRALSFLERDGSRDYAWDELMDLNRALLSVDSIEKTACRLFHEALLGQISLEQVRHQFEEQVVLAVYRENRSIRSTAEVLRMGTNKLQKILRQVDMSSLK